MKKVYLLTLLFLVCASSGFSQNVRSYDGSNNNTANPDWGKVAAQLMRMTSNGYGDEISALGGTARPNPRLISNVIFNQSTSIPNELNISDFGWAFGQFMDHDVTFVDDNPNELIPIPVPVYDAFFDPMGTGTQTIPMKRSKSDSATGTSTVDPRMQVNDITSFVDASNVYGSDTARALWLRTFSDGKLKTSAGNLLPFNTISGEFGDAIDPSAPFMLNENLTIDKFFIAGDVRANEQPILSSLHTLFMREHNRLCDEFKAANPSLTDEELYQKARKWVGAFIQSIAYEQWLPTLGVHLDPYPGYDGNMRPDIMNVFSAAAFRIGHTLINGDLVRLDASGNPHALGNVSLKDAFFNPLILKDEDGIEPFFRGMATQKQQKADTKVIGDLRNFLFGPPGAGGLDLVATNIQRGRERGLVDYNWIRQDVNLPKYTSFSEITSDPVLINNMVALFGSIDNIDPWVGMLAEDHVAGGAFGITITNILKEQFKHLRDGDRFYYENDTDFSGTDIQTIKNTKFSDIIKRNTSVSDIQDDVFVVNDPMTALEDELQHASFLTDLKAYPNPVQDAYTLSFHAGETGEMQIEIMDMMGRVLERDAVRIQNGKNTFEMNMNERFAAGIYHIALRIGNETNVVKVVKQ